RCGHRAQDLVALLVIAFVVEEDDRERLVCTGIMEKKHLGRIHPLGLFAALDLALQRGHPIGVDSVERNDACQCHRILLWLSLRAHASGAGSASAATVRQLRCVPGTSSSRSSRAAESRAPWTPAGYWT